ncbi:hypothetical protein CUR178_03407 [Leishmania enriettii]|uniref:Metallo-beta-lactamase domain-containing protein n=1 Tax=Leishmania enriettii TaxID=5663 RepID=A0A836KR40_LEIEN|nr:hypothetical protein CUR178_03407 [Leishmania enriettii]
MCAAFPIRHSHIASQPVQAPPPGYMSLTVVGSGVSTGVPVIGHLGRGCACDDAVADPSGPNSRNNISLLITLPRRDLPDLTETRAESPAADRKETENDSENGRGSTAGGVSAKASGPSHSRFAAESAGNYIGAKPVAHILIDCGKTFRDAYFKVMIRYNIRMVDTLLLTHEHADAVAGLDDLRDLQRMHMVPTGDWVVDSFVPTYLSPTTLRTLEKSVDYIIRNSLKSGRAMPTSTEHAAQLAKCLEQREAQAVVYGTAQKESGWRNIGIRRSTALDLFCMDEERPVRMHLPITATSATAGSTGACDAASDLPFYSFPVEHGKGCTSMAWVFGRGTAFKSQQAQQHQQSESEGSCVVYISDVSDIPAASMAFLQDLVKIDVLVLDLVAEHGAPSPSHYCADETIPLVMALAPRRTYFVGMFCSLKHHATDELLALELAELTERCRDELDAEVPGASASAVKRVEKEKKLALLNQVRSIELGCDVQQLDMDA